MASKRKCTIGGIVATNAGTLAYINIIFFTKLIVSNHLHHYNGSLSCVLGQRSIVFGFKTSSRNVRNLA